MNYHAIGILTFLKRLNENRASGEGDEADRRCALPRALFTRRQGRETVPSGVRAIVQEGIPPSHGYRAAFASSISIPSPGLPLR